MNEKLELNVHVREHKDDGSPESSWPSLEGAKVWYLAGAGRNDQGKLQPAITGANGIAKVGGDDVEVYVEGPSGYEDYRGIYNRPATGSNAELPVSLRRL